MIEVNKYILPEVVPRDEILAWQDSIRKIQPKENCPEEVRQFVNALAGKLGDFGQIRKFNTSILGKDLLLCNMKEMNGEKINAYDVYHLPVPHMIAVDNYSSMMRIFRRKGKQGLIDYCQAKVKGTELAQILEILNVSVFHVERPEFTRVMNEIQGVKKLEIEMEQ